MKAPSMRNWIMAAGLSAALATPAYAQVAVVDAGSIGHLLTQIEEMRKQLETQQDTLEAMTGSRSWNTGSFNEYSENLPEEWGDVYNDAMGGNSQYSGEAQSVLDSLREEVEGMNELEASRHINERIKEKNATDRVMMQRAYDNHQLELREMEELAEEIEQAETQKEIQDLQARIQTAQGAIQASHVKLKNMAMLQEVQSNLLEDQRDQAARNRLVGDGGEDAFSSPEIN
ncbi:MAG: type IV secretion system protein [Pseudomonadota bacterium]